MGLFLLQKRCPLLTHFLHCLLYNESIAYHVKSQGGVAEWLRHSVTNHARSARVGSDLVVGTTNHKLTVNSAAHPPEVGENVYSEVTLRAQALDTH